MILTVFQTSENDARLVTNITLLFCLLQAIDYDSGANGTVTYRVLTEDGIDKSRNAAGSLFVIDDVTGELRLNLSNLKLNQSLGLHRIAVEVKAWCF